MLTDEMRRIARDHPLGIVATVNADGTPNVSPKGTMVVLDHETVVFGEIASPGTLANIAARPAMEVNFVDVLARGGFRASGTAEALPPGSVAFNARRRHVDRLGVVANYLRQIIRS